MINVQSVVFPLLVLNESIHKLFFISFLCLLCFYISLDRMSIKNTTWSLSFKPILQSLSQFDSEYRLVGDIVQHIKQKIIDLHYYRRFFTKTKQKNLHLVDTRKLTIERLHMMLFGGDEKQMINLKENTQRYGFPLKMVYTHCQLSPKTRLTDLVTEDDLEELIAETTKDDHLWVLQTRYLHSPLSVNRTK